MPSEMRAGAAETACPSPLSPLAAHPVALAAIGVLLVNDHWAKARFHNALTGKVSDVAGLIFFPLVLLALFDVAHRRTRGRGLSTIAAVSTIITVGAVFAATKLGGPITWFDTWAVGIARWPLQAGAALAAGEALPSLRPIVVTQDLTDVWCIAALLIPLALAAGAHGRVQTHPFWVDLSRCQHGKVDPKRVGTHRASRHAHEPSGGEPSGGEPSGGYASRRSRR